MADDITSAWTVNEIEQYQDILQTKYHPLQILYAQRGLPPENPVARAQFLAKDVLHLSDDAIGLFRGIEHREGRLTLMSTLENYVATTHKSGTLQFPEQI